MRLAESQSTGTYGSECKKRIPIIRILNSIKVYAFKNEDRTDSAKINSEEKAKQEQLINAPTTCGVSTDHTDGRALFVHPSVIVSTASGAAVEP